MKRQTKTIILSAYLASSFFVCANASTSNQISHLSSSSTSNHSEQVVKKARNDRNLSSQTIKALVSATTKNRSAFISTHILHKTKAERPVFQAQ
ncbi:hypothetical protein KUL42_12050 [Alteromonas sp. KUL42]|uniref:hypothetical protein n=1 Tax=Alteromonas sp. KUL42 TaxID=2480797 RepID=UPI0010ED68A6|nr:hypothetical protein [Alteromonas sp. KUL42]TAP37043.1 hypothetical protein EYR97_05975 [Alteromonas sp. KUL42]GEA06444.1 hypothetical protein KUL42_12050 [Alteromonas sp. KUL42]